MRPAGAAAIAGSPARDMSLCGELLQAPPSLVSQPPAAAPSGPQLIAAAGATLNRLPEPLLRRLSGSLDRAPEGRGWRKLAEVAGSRGRLRLRCGNGAGDGEGGKKGGDHVRAGGRGGGVKWAREREPGCGDQ